MMQAFKLGDVAHKVWPWVELLIQPSGEDRKGDAIRVFELLLAAIPAILAGVAILIETPAPVLGIILAVLLTVMIASSIWLQGELIQEDWKILRIQLSSNKRGVWSKMLHVFQFVMKVGAAVMYGIPNLLLSFFQKSHSTAGYTPSSTKGQDSFQEHVGK